MTKKEIKNTINRAVYIYAESLGYQISDDDDGSYVTFYKCESDSNEDSIDYSRSYHTTVTYNWASEECKADADLIEEYAKQVQLKYQQ